VNTNVQGTQVLRLILGAYEALAEKRTVVLDDVSARALV
jgi:hypothetical protein